MEKICFDKLGQLVDTIPDSVGVFLFSGDDDILFVKSTENLRRFIFFYALSERPDPSIAELRNQSKTVSYRTFDSLMTSFINELVYIHEEKPVFNNIIKPWHDYVYLGVNFDTPPFIKVCDDTLLDFYYIGPYRNKFALNDIMDTFSQLFGLPRCVSEDFPCDKLEDQLCHGYCTKQVKEALPELLNRLLMVPNKEAVQRLHESVENLKDDLAFTQADILSDQIFTIKKYYKNLMFSYTNQFITGKYIIDGFTIDIKDGMICEIVSPKVHTHIYTTDLSYRRANELLAYQKAEYDHRWIVFAYMYDFHPHLIEKLFMDHIVELQKDMFASGND
jgi:excinuclease UvrABC nuclease subunit